MTVKSELLAIKSASDDGMLHCHKAVEWARENPGSALHSAIEWDNDKAADAHRLWQVRRLIDLHIKSDIGGPTVVSLSIDRRAGGGYRSVSDVVAAPDLRAVMLQDALDELERMQTKYARVTELAAVWHEADRVRQERGGKTKKAA